MRSGAAPRRRSRLSRFGRVIGVLLLCLVFVPLILPLPSGQGLVEPAALANADSRFLEVDGVTLHYKLYGSGEPVLVLLHGFGASEFSWRHVVAPLATMATVIAFDRPGFGLTERPMPGEWTDVNPYSDQGYASLTIGLLEALQVKRAVLIGHSAGGGLALQIALEHPELVTGLVLVAPALGGGYERSGVLRWLATTPQGRRIGPWLARASYGLLARVLDTAWHDPELPDAATVAGYERPLGVRNWERAFWELTFAAKGEALTGALPRLSLPVLYLTGDDDRIVPPDGTRQAAALTPGSTLIVVAECGHLPHEEKPEEFIAAVEAFLARIDGARP